MFVQRRIKVTLSGDGGTAVFEGLRTMVRVVKAGAPYNAQAEITLFGLGLDHINNLSTRMLRYRPYLNFAVAVEAGDDVNGMSTVFVGTVQQSWGDFSNMPEVAFFITAQGGTPEATAKNIQPTSANGNVKVAPLIEKLAGLGSLGFRNHGVNKVINNIYTWGSPQKQIREIADMAGAQWVIDDKVCKIWNRGEALPGQIVVSPETGLRDYPTFTKQGIMVKVEFTRSIDYRSNIIVKSDLRDANGSWNIIKIDYDLAAEIPGGNWFAIIDAEQLGAGTQFIGG